MNLEGLYRSLMSIPGGRDWLLVEMLNAFLFPHRTVVANLALSSNETADVMRCVTGNRCYIGALSVRMLRVRGTKG